MNLDSPIQYLPKVGPVMAKRLLNLNILTVSDLLYHIPFRYEDYSLISKINTIQVGEIVTIIGKVINAKNIYSKFGKKIQNVEIADETGKITAIWFNQPFLIKSFQIDSKIAISGKIDFFGSKKAFISPDYEIIIDDKPLVHTGKIIPIYPETEGISSKFLRNRIIYLLNNLLLEEFLPKAIIQKYNFPQLKEAISKIHFPDFISKIDLYKNRLAFDELFLLELLTLKRKQEWQKKIIVKPLTIVQNKIDQFIKSLPFVLTFAQNRVITEILTDLKSNKPMNRLLEGDVGSGKTVVAAIACYAVFLNNFKSIFMAPTEILAEQHYKTLTNLLNPFKIKVSLITSSHKLSTTNYELSTNIIIGTHALLENKIKFEKVKLIIIDEQHRFGVEQRAKLRLKSDNPHLLTMTATPIPRTIALTLYGDLDLSVLDQMPKNRKPIKTFVVPQEKRTKAYAWIEKHLVENQAQAFIICPFIEPSETFSTIKSAKLEFENLKKHIFPKLKLKLLHGKMKSLEKNQILTDFKNKKFDILVSTPVVEVGIDITNAEIMLIEGAERFGLAALHQLRGRVGRGDKQSYCLLFTSNSNTNIIRLKYLEKAISGLELAEADLKFRGPGDIYGINQHGFNLLKIASFSDTKLISQARLEAINVLKTDPDLITNLPLKQHLKSSTISEVSPD